MTIIRMLTGVARRTANAHAGAPLPRAHHNPSRPLAAGTTPKPANQAIARRSFFDHGPGFIAGVVTVEDVPATRLVRLLDAKTGRLVASVFSGPDGRYRFDQLPIKQRFTVLATDYTQQFNAVVADSVVAALV